MYEKGDLLKSKTSGEYATVIREPFTKLFRDASDWEAMRYGGGDYATAATAIRIMYHKGGYERTLKSSTVRRTFEKVAGK